VNSHPRRRLAASTRRRAPARSQRGQALIWLLGTLAASAAILYGVYNVSQTVNGKEKAVNAADASALAGATVEARMLNLMAYNNRSMVANEVFVAQLVSLDSWLGWAKSTAQNFATVLAFVIPLEEIAIVLEDTANVIGEIRDGEGELTDVAIGATEVEKQVLGAAHGVVSTLGFGAAEDAATTVAKANRADFNAHADAGVSRAGGAAEALTLGLNTASWVGFTRQYTGNQRGDSREVIQNARDQFATERKGHTFPFNIDYIPLPPLKFGTEKNGPTVLKTDSSGNDRWESEDTLEFWEKPIICFKHCDRSYQPVSWGGANADKNGGHGNSALPPGRFAQDMAWEDSFGHSHGNGSIASWSGAPSFYDVDVKKDRTTLAVEFTSVVVRAKSANPTSTNLGMQSVHSNNVLGSSEMPERLQGNQLAALAKAHVFFMRPQRGIVDKTAPGDLARPDNAKEYGSLYSPYWEARLMDFSMTDKMKLYAALGVNPLYAKMTPGG
jgi:hypothetical protein